MDVRIANFRKWENKSVLAFFDVVFDDALVVRGFVLAKSKEGKYYWRPPSKARVEKGTGNIVKDEKGYDVYDPIADLWGARKEGKFEPTEGAWELRQAIIDQAVSIYENGTGEESGKGRGGSKSAKASQPAKTTTTTKPATATTKVDTGDGENAEDGDVDDDLPF